LALDIKVFYKKIEIFMDFLVRRDDDDDDAMETSELSIMSLGMSLLTTLCLVMSFEACHSGREITLEDQPIQRKFQLKSV
jgi:hypothetical protein